MKNLKTALIICLISAGCAAPRVQLISLSTEKIKNQDKEVIFENDTLIVKYNFYNLDGPITFTIFNKLDIPLYVDWKKSAFIIGSQKIDYWYDTADFNANTSSMSIQWTSWFSTNHGTVNGVISKADRIVFLPPKTEIMNSRYWLHDFYKTKISGITPEVSEEKINFTGYKTNKKTKIFTFNYTEDNAPLKFRNYLTFSTKQDFTDEFHLDSEFWIDQVAIMDARQFTGSIYPDTGLTNPNSTITNAHPYKASNKFYVKIPVDNYVLYQLK